MASCGYDTIELVISITDSRVYAQSLTVGCKTIKILTTKPIATITKSTIGICLSFIEYRKFNKIKSKQEYTEGKLIKCFFATNASFD